MKFFNDMSIAKKLLGAFSAIVLVIVVAGGITVYEIDAADGAVAENQTLVQFGKDLGTLERAGAAQLLAVRGLLLTGDRGQIDAYREAVAQFDATVERMAGHAPTAEAQSAFEGLVALVRDWQTETAATQIEGMSNPLTVDAARAMEANGLGSDFMLALNEAASALKRATEVRIQAAEEATETSFLVTIIAAFGGSLVALIIATVAYFALKGAISAPIARMTEVMGVLADGRDDVDVPNTRRADEVGAMGRALEVFKQNAIERREALAREEEAREKEKEQVKAREERTRRIEELIATFDKQSAELVEALSTSARSLEDTSKVMNESAENTDKQATAVAAASEEASTNVQTVASAAEQLRASITEIAEQVARVEFELLNNLDYYLQRHPWRRIRKTRIDRVRLATAMSAAKVDALGFLDSVPDLAGLSGRADT
jgi:methyl-accepting chemotaxis protein